MCSSLISLLTSVFRRRNNCSIAISMAEDTLWFAAAANTRIYRLELSPKTPRLADLRDGYTRSSQYGLFGSEHKVAFGCGGGGTRSVAASNGNRTSIGNQAGRYRRRDRLRFGIFFAKAFICSG